MMRQIGLAGLGFLGRGIAKCLLDHGFEVVALERDEKAWQAVERATNLIRAEHSKQLAGCELIIESITEDFAAKQSLYDELETYVSSEVPIASNTSGFSITKLQTGRRHPNRFAGMHWAPPAYATRFMEIVKGDQTSDEVVHRIRAIAIELHKEPAIVQKDVPGFVANRIAYAMYREAIHLLETGVADAETIDSLCRQSLGLWTPVCGPFRWMDVTGGPALYAKAMETIVPTLSNESEVPETMRRMQGENRRGTLNGEGFYPYETGDAEKWQQRLREHALWFWSAGGREPPA